MGKSGIHDLLPAIFLDPRPETGRVRPVCGQDGPKTHSDNLY
jgi:hypothetical protein